MLVTIALTILIRTLAITRVVNHPALHSFLVPG